MKTVRQVAFDIIQQVLSGEQYSNLLINRAIQSKDVEGKDIGLLTELVYGTVQRKLTLDFYLEPFITGKRVDDDVMNNLRLAVYQAVYLDRIPQHAIVHEAVELAKDQHPRASGFINGVLRSFFRQPLRDISEIDDPMKRLSIETSTPLWIIKLWTKQYDFELAKTLAEIGQTKPYQFARINRLKGSREAVLSRLEEQGIEYETVHNHPDAIYLSTDNIANTPAYKMGYVTVQDLSSQWVGRLLAPKKGERVLDCCAAPGGKATHLAEIMENEGEVIAGDLYDHKIGLIREHVNRLGTTIVRPIRMDTTMITERFEKESFDRVLLDAPCSGFGVIHRKPEIKYNRKPEDLDALITLQRAMIDEAVQLVKPGGHFVYSTCTINKKENEKMVEYLLERYPDFSLDPTPIQQYGLDEHSNGYIRLVNHHPGADAFFISCFKRN